MFPLLVLTRAVSGLVVLCFLLSGCSYEVLHYSAKNNRTYASNNASVSSVPASGIHRVESGETLFSIAFRYGLDYRELAQANRIDSPYVIYPKQKIRLDVTGNPPVKVANNTSTPASASARAATEIPMKIVPPKPIATTKEAKKIAKSDVKDEKIASGWSWPVNGTVTRGFSNAGVSSKGIDIKAPQGELVKAAADGTVVYAGSGLIGYGNLVIVKHNDVYLSAYAYNERILVKEQQNVRMGDSLAVIGGKGEERPLLHFEVRRDGQPIDPLDVLPKIK
ncbi:peptidoglycan DD-metalloendopeptidase family protein [Marinomonas sp. IMCC 4694]|uniref:peptidoglycan DD-metalloendopeptidase family protein n=1 Tax=Marinomonas sp. IMCC 4694 TaxID=2605432 RepID=UPI0011E886E5|nr:peptidoglycan DD-metalloendopeptidase family protein [Marinomonas sp. IMCC 4694]TYL47266.1 peptidoglycan DD-metalloendopeptidase family protein [Marinomonas sp. IMCC 4694]